MLSEILTNSNLDIETFFKAKYGLFFLMYLMQYIYISNVSSFFSFFQIINVLGTTIALGLASGCQTVFAQVLPLKCLLNPYSSELFILIFRYLKLWIAVARHNIKCLKNYKLETHSTFENLYIC